MKTNQLNRRNFLARSTAATAGLFSATPQILRAQGPVAANDKLNIGFIGSAGQAGFSIDQLKGIANVAALCDVDEKRLGPVAQKFPGAKTYRDFRRLVDQKNLDAIVVATPDHTHAVASVAALRSGRHLYCEKPLARTVSEARVVTELARETNLVTQIGTQIHAGGNYRRVVELVRSGAIGEVKEVHVWVGGGFGGKERYKKFPPVPSHLDWDLWLGPIKEQPYHPDWAHFNWRHWWHFGGGTLADIGCHYMDLPFWALDLHQPVSVEAQGPPVHAESAPTSLTVRYQFPARVVKGRHWDPLKLTWYHGGRYPEELITPEQHKRWGSAILFVGDKGQLISNYGSHALLPEDKFKDTTRPTPFIQDSKGHHLEWINAIRTGGSTTCRFDYSGPLTETVLLGNVAFRTGQRLEWDAAKMKATNCAEADQFIQHHYRGDWDRWFRG